MERRNYLTVGLRRGFLGGVRLKDAISRGQKLVDDEVVTGTDAIAVHCLVQMAKRVRRVQKPLRQVERALCPQEEMNQLSLVDENG